MRDKVDLLAFRRVLQAREPSAGVAARPRLLKPHELRQLSGAPLSLGDVLEAWLATHRPPPGKAQNGAASALLRGMRKREGGPSEKTLKALAGMVV